MNIPKITPIDLPLKEKRQGQLLKLLYSKFIAIGQHIAKNENNPSLELFDLMTEQCYLYYVIKQKKADPKILKFDQKLMGILNIKLNWLQQTNNYSLNHQREMYFTKMQIEQGRIMFKLPENDNTYIKLLYIEKICLIMRNKLKDIKRERLDNLIRIFYICQEIKAMKDQMEEPIEYISHEEALIRTDDRIKDYDYLLGLLKQKLPLLKEEIKNHKLTNLERVNLEIELWQLAADIEAKQTFRDIYEKERKKITN
jgi:hypothetical protein